MFAALKERKQIKNGRAVLSAMKHNMSESTSQRLSPDQKMQSWAVSGYNIENRDVSSKHQTLRQFNTDINVNFQRGYGNSVVTSVNPVSFKRSSDPNKYWNPVIPTEQTSVTVVDKPIERIVEVFHRVPMDKVVERNVESIKVEEKHLEKDIKITQVVPVIQARTRAEDSVGLQEIKKEVVYEKEVLKEEVQEIVVDKYVERVWKSRIVEVIREVEVIKEVPTIRYVDRVITKEVPVTQVVERVV
ncbi:hypothetical protein GUITHDRAFT_144262 [Guillardia theta CCMP2712]|uniref:Uncharacterized protein n=1 Tax=Guillardia theta (strain CCMP2712) TaxID=905079 RepID=L1IR79_GUITC|nr:hypothetical protein GUITHDRAFT_144262 [Guillardia theta CCMP2712]EKX38315.1 hypothetical protein GUITHDRAFT_144262 [Guillardia theta CCMP2712]|eukprot:XP_005825295.1 hypothetical protein GUITHDRAFT_144262 [Guillardia theta CCMP2712]